MAIASCDRKSKSYYAVTKSPTSFSIGRYAEAELLAREARGALLDTDVGRSVRVPWIMITLGHALTAAGQLDEAEPLLRECVRMLEEWRLHRTHVDMLGGEARSVLGQCLASQGRDDEAEPLLLEGYRMILKVIAVRRPQAARARSRLVELYEAWGKAASAAQWRDDTTGTNP